MPTQTALPLRSQKKQKNRRANPAASEWQHHGQVVHVFTHFRLELEVWSTDVADISRLEDGWWADPHALGQEALPTLFRKVLAAAGLEN